MYIVLSNSVTMKVSPPSFLGMLAHWRVIASILNNVPEQRLGLIRLPTLEGFLQAEQGKTFRLVDTTPARKQPSSPPDQSSESPALTKEADGQSKVEGVATFASGPALLPLDRAEEELLGGDPVPMEVSAGEETKLLALDTEASPH
jgi:hypothetical protein